MRKNLAAFIVLSCLVMNSCKKDEDTVVSYQNEVKPIFTSNCVSCHTATGAASSTGLFFDTYENTVAATSQQKNGENLVLGAIKHNPGFTPMPEGGQKLSDTNIGKIEDWINEGRLNN